MTDELSRRALIGSLGLLGAASASAVGKVFLQAPARRFIGKVALVTGATSGMGAITARALAAESAMVIFCGRREDEGRLVEQEIITQGGIAQFVRTDVTDEDQVKALIQGIADRHGRLDFAFNNVGTSDGSGLLHEISVADFDLVNTTNLRGNFLQLKYELQLMLKSGGGVIVGNSSIAGIRYLATKAHYSATKHGVIGMYCASALGYASHNIRINVICPGLIKTEKAMRVLGGNERALDGRIPMGHIGESTDVAAAVLWLFSDEARYITGAVLPIDGGQSVA
ncbi:MAG: SDR family oxidoreductase [Gammaproteobacteria bacterium]|nr:SDR family oxidoreductase [Gammaproteobacteria bacterium]